MTDGTIPEVTISLRQVTGAPLLDGDGNPVASQENNVGGKAVSFAADIHRKSDGKHLLTTSTKNSPDEAMQAALSYVETRKA